MRQTDELSDFREFNDQNINNKDETTTHITVPKINIQPRSRFRNEHK